MQTVNHKAHESRSSRKQVYAKQGRSAIRAEWQCGECKVELRTRPSHSPTISSLMWGLKESHESRSPECLEEPDPNSVRLVQG